jgi:hypothetical protein
MAEAPVVVVVAGRCDKQRGGLVAVDAVAVGVDETQVGLVGRSRRAGRRGGRGRLDGEREQAADDESRK